MSRSITKDGVAFDVRGPHDAAVTALLVRPLGGNMDLWGAFRSDLANAMRVVSFDARGTGRSSGSEARTSIGAMAEDARAVLDAVDAAQACVFGLSLGAAVAIDLAARAPDRVAKLALASPPTRASSLVRIGARGAGMAACLVKKEPELDECLAERVLTPGFGAEHPREMRWIKKAIRRRPSTRKTVLRHVAAIARARTRPKLDAITAPMLVITGARDHLLGPDAGADIVRVIAGARQVVIADAGHDLSLEAPRELARVVREFFLA